MIDYIISHWQGLALAYTVYIVIPATFLGFIMIVEETV